MFTHVLIPSDGSPISMNAAKNILQFAREIGAKVTILTVIEPFHTFSLAPAQVSSTSADYHEHARIEAGRILDAAESQATALGLNCATVQIEHEHPHEAIIGTALERGCDLIAMASHGRRGLSAVMLGSRAHEGAHPFQDPGARLSLIFTFATCCLPEELAIGAARLDAVSDEGPFARQDSLQAHCHHPRTSRLPWRTFLPCAGGCLCAGWPGRRP